MTNAKPRTGAMIDVSIEWTPYHTIRVVGYFVRGCEEESSADWIEDMAISHQGISLDFLFRDSDDELYQKIHAEALKKYLWEDL